MGNVIENAIPNKNKNNILRPVSRAYNIPQMSNQIKSSTENIVTSGINAVQNNEYHQKLSEEKREGTEKGEAKKDKHWTRYVPVAAGALLLSATVPSIVKSGDVTKPLQDIRDGIKRMPAATINKAKKNNPVVKEAVKAVEKEVNKSGGKAKNINNSPLARFGLGLMQGTGAFVPFLAGSAYLSHKAKTAPDEKSKEEAERLKDAHGSINPIGAAGIKVYDVLHKKADFDEEYEKTALSEETLLNYAKKRKDQYYDNARENIRTYNSHAKKYIRNLQDRYGTDNPDVQKKINGIKLDMSANRASELNRAKNASWWVENRIKNQRKLYEGMAKKRKEKAKEEAYKTIAGKMKWNANEIKDNAKNYFDKNKHKLAVATGVLTAGAAINTIHNKFLKPKLNDMVKGGIKKHYDKKIDKLYQQKREKDESTEKKASIGYFNDTIDAIALNAAKVPVDLAWTAGSELIKQNKRFNREKDKINNGSYHERKDDNNDRRNNVNNKRSRKRNKNFKHNIQSKGRQNYAQNS